MSKIISHEPMVLCFGVVDENLNVVLSQFRYQLERSIGKQSFNYSKSLVNWSEFFADDGLLYDGTRFQISIFTIHSLTVYVCNLADGWSSIFENCVTTGKFDAYFFRATLSEDVKYKVNEMMMWRKGQLKRHLRSLQDDTGWEFVNSGEPLPFEDEERYRKRQIRDRFDRILLENYCEAATGIKVNLVTEFDCESWLFWQDSGGSDDH